MVFRKVFIRTVSVLFIIGGIYFAVAGVRIYSQQLEQRDWHTTKAIVTDTEKRSDSYDVTYRYGLGGETYYGKIIGTINPPDSGKNLDIKYNPENPEQSTDILEPQESALAVNLLFGVFNSLIGLWFSGILPYILKKIKQT